LRYRERVVVSKSPIIVRAALGRGGFSRLDNHSKNPFEGTRRHPASARLIFRIFCFLIFVFLVFAAGMVKLPTVFVADLEKIHSGGNMLLALVNLLFSEDGFGAAYPSLHALWHKIRTPVNTIIGYGELSRAVR
jgi:hypothetical protein